MERPVFHPIGTPVQQLDTPALVVDLAAMGRNIEQLQSFFQSSTAKLRPHVTAYKCPTIAHKQLAGGGTVGGISVSRVGEAEVFADAGFTDILVAEEVVTRAKINRLCALAHSLRIAVAVDNPLNVQALSNAAQSSGVVLHVLVDINTGLDRCGVEPRQPTLELAQKISSSDGLRLAGLMAYEGEAQENGHQTETAAVITAVQAVLDTKELIEKSGLKVETVSLEGTRSYEVVGAMKGVTEVRMDTFPLMDGNLRQSMPDFQPAAKVMATVVSHPNDSTVITDAGHKATGPDRGMPTVTGVNGASLARLSAEHSILNLEPEAQRALDVGSKIWLIPSDLELCVNQYNYIHAVRNAKLEAVWEIAARGRSD